MAFSKRANLFLYNIQMKKIRMKTSALMQYELLFKDSGHLTVSQQSVINDLLKSNISKKHWLHDFLHKQRKPLHKLLHEVTYNLKQLLIYRNQTVTGPCNSTVQPYNKNLDSVTKTSHAHLRSLCLDSQELQGFLKSLQ